MDRDEPYLEEDGEDDENGPFETLLELAKDFADLVENRFYVQFVDQPDDVVRDLLKGGIVSLARQEKGAHYQRRVMEYNLVAHYAHEILPYLDFDEEYEAWSKAFSAFLPEERRDAMIQEEKLRKLEEDEDDAEEIEEFKRAMQNVDENSEGSIIITRNINAAKSIASHFVRLSSHYINLWLKDTSRDLFAGEDAVKSLCLGEVESIHGTNRETLLKRTGFQFIRDLAFHMAKEFIPLAGGTMLTWKVVFSEVINDIELTEIEEKAKEEVGKV